MKIEFGLQTAQKQGLALTAQVQQAIKLLHMTNVELQTFVEEQFIENPFLEDNHQQIDVSNSSVDINGAKNTHDILKDNPHLTSETTDKVKIDNQFETGESYLPKSTVSKSQSDLDLTSLVVENERSLYAYVLEYVETLNLSVTDKIIATQIVECLEPTGWITDSIQSIADSLQCPNAEVQRVLQLLQQIEPAGLFATSLKQCLALQAESRGVLSPKLKIVLENLHLMGSGKFDLLKRRCKCNDNELFELFKIIKSLNPKPGLRFDNQSIPLREPDLIVVKTSDGWEVELNNSTLPSVNINLELSNKLKNYSRTIKEKDFFREKLIEAKWLTNAIAKRNETMLKVGVAILNRQTEFLEKGAGYIQPMVLNDIAADVGMHESTISRVTTGSLIQTPRGTLELKSFFSVGVKQSGGQDVTAASSIRFHVKQLIETENKNQPLSDDQIVDILAQKGIEIARRTVTKYRKMDNLPSSFSRKRRAILSGAYSN